MNFKTIYPDLEFCGDNAAMIAWAGIQRFKRPAVNMISLTIILMIITITVGGNISIEQPKTNEISKIMVSYHSYIFGK